MVTSVLYLSTVRCYGHYDSQHMMVRKTRFNPPLQKTSFDRGGMETSFDLGGMGTRFGLGGYQERDSIGGYQQNDSNQWDRQHGLCSVWF